MTQAAKDDAERERQRTRLYAPPPGARGRRGTRDGPGGAPGGVSRGQAQALIAQMAAEDTRYGGGT